MWYNLGMQTQRTITIILPDDADLRATLLAFRDVQQKISSVCFNDGKPLKAVPLQRACYHEIKGSLSSQMTITALRLVAGAYASAKSNKKPAQKPFAFNRASAMFLVGNRGRDADFRKDGTLSIWTIAGRKRLSYTIPDDFKERFNQAVEVDSLTVIERSGKLIGRVVLTLEYPNPKGVYPIGIDLNETNALVAVNPDGETLFVSGRDTKVRNKRTRQARKRIQRKRDARKAQKKDTRSTRRLLKRLSRKQSNRTKTFAQTTAKRLCEWAKPDSVLVFEALNIPQPKKGAIKGKPLRRRLSEWQRGLIRQFSENKAVEFGLSIAEVDPRYTSQNCSRCGLKGNRKRHSFSCPHCGFTDHADINAAKNIRNRFVALRGDGHPSICLEAQTEADSVEVMGKPSALADGY